jgi:MoaA/NifB/PqqE/SkfB family radical SAM enzyme
MDEKVKRLSKWAKGGNAPPLTLELNITNKCNLLCKMCWLRSTKPIYNEMSDEELLQIVDDAIDLGVKEFRFPGSGEPLARKDILFKLMKKVKDGKGIGLLISNGTLFTEDDVKRLVEMEWDVLTISLDGPSPEINDYIRGERGAFKKAVRTLNLLKKWKARLKKDCPWLRMNVVLTNRNYDKLADMIKLAKKFDFKEVLLQPMTVFSDEGEKLKVENIEDASKYLEKAVEMARRLEIKTNMDSFVRNVIVERTGEMDKMIMSEIKRFDSGFLSVPCYEPFYNLIIMPDGKAGPCAIAGGKTEADVVGRGLKEVWFGELFEGFRNKMLNKELFPFCSHCCVPVFLENKRLREELAKVV